MKTNTNILKSRNIASENLDIAIDNMLDKVSARLTKLKNKDYLVDYLVASGLSIELAKKMVHRTL